MTASDAATAVTKLLLDWESGDPSVEERLMPLLYVVTFLFYPPITNAPETS